MAAITELPFEVQRHEARQRATFKASNGFSATKYLTPNFLTHFPVVMESTEDEEHLTWNEVSGLFWRRDTIPATFMDAALLVEQVDLDVFGKPDMEVAECCVLALFKLVTQEGEEYALTVIYIPYHQKRMHMKDALQAVYTTTGNAVALVGMPKDPRQYAYMPEPTNGEHYTLLPVCGDVGTTSGPVSDFAAAMLTKGSTHYRVNKRVVVKLPGSFTQDTTSRGLIDEEVFDRGSIWTNKELVEIGLDGIPVVVNGRTVAIEREIIVSKMDVYTDTTAFHPLTLVACEPGYEPDYAEFTESLPEMQARVEGKMDVEWEAQRQERICHMQEDEGRATGMDTTPAPPDPSAIPGTDLHIVTPPGVVMQDFSKTGQVVMDLTESTDKEASTGNVGGQATKLQGATGGSKAGAQISDAELSARLLMFKCLDLMTKDQNILEDGYYKCVEAVRGVVKEVSADLDDIENAYVAAIMKGLGEMAGVWHQRPSGHAHHQRQRVGQAPFRTHPGYCGVPQCMHGSQNN